MEIWDALFSNAKWFGKFYDELFSIGVASVTSYVFEFNNLSIKLYEKVAELNGIRLELYYINQNLWDMNFYSKVNSAIDTFVKEYLYVKIRRLKK